MAVLVVPQETYHAAAWTLTGDSYLTEFNGDAANIISNGYTVYVNGTALTGTN